MTDDREHWRNIERDAAASESKRRNILTASTAPIALVTPGCFSGQGGPSEESLAREWVALYGDDWRHDHTIGRFLRWSGNHWAQDNAEVHFHLFGEHMRAAEMGKNARAAVARGMRDFIKANPRVAVTHDQFDADPMLLGTPGGTIDLRTGKVRPAERSDNITRLTSVAARFGRKPARWLEFLNQATGGDVPLMAYLQVVCGYCLTGLTGLTSAHVLFFLYGAGKNGKSVFINTFTRILGDYATTASMETFTASKGDKHPTDLARLDGARLVAASETEEGRAWAESRIKQLTGGDRIAARFMRQDFFEFTPRFKLVIAGNFQPQLHNVDEAMRRRFHMIPFIHTPANPDLKLEEKLVAEHPSILAWMIEGARIWHLRGLQRPDAVIDASDRYFEEQDLFGHWIGERCIVRAGAIGRAGELFESWRTFARQNGEEPGTQKGMAGALRKRGFQGVRVSGGGRAWSGIELAQVFRESDA